MPYDEADPVFNIALNLLAEDTCLEHLELRRTEEAYLNTVGAQRIPDPTTAGDFCRRFGELKILHLMQGVNRARQMVWKQQTLSNSLNARSSKLTEPWLRPQRKEGIGMKWKNQ